MSDELAERCVAAWAKCPKPYESFTMKAPGRFLNLWLVGFADDDGKHVASGDSLTAALTAWLADYEQWWDDPA